MRMISIKQLVVRAVLWLGGVARSASHRTAAIALNNCFIQEVRVVSARHDVVETVRQGNSECCRALFNWFIVIKNKSYPINLIDNSQELSL
jgi:hypothetical protein